MNVPQEGQCYWFETVKRPSFKVHEMPKHADVVIVGGGIGGLSTAYHLQKKGRKVVLIEKDKIAMGASGRNSGMLSSEIEKTFNDIIADDGLEEAMRMFRLVKSSVDGIERLTRKEKIDCDFRRTESLYIADGPRTEAILDEELDAARRFGIKCRMYESKEIPKKLPFLKATRVLKRSGEASFNPYAFCLGLAKAVEKNGGRFHEGVTYLSHEENGDGVIVHTDRGSIRSGHLCLCSDGDTQKFLPVATPVIPTLESIAVTSVFPRSVKLQRRKEIMWNAYELFEYARVVGGRRILLGSGRTLRLANEKGFDPLRILQEAIRDLFNVPDFGVDYLWTGKVSVTDDWRPYADFISAHVLVAGGYNGHGMTLGFIGGEILSSLITSQRHPFEDVFSYPHKTQKVEKFLYRIAPKPARKFATRLEMERLRLKDTWQRANP